MKILLTAIVVVGIFAIGCEQIGDKGSESGRNLDGTWRAETEENGPGHLRAKKGTIKLVVSGDKVTLTVFNCYGAINGNQSTIGYRYVNNEPTTTIRSDGSFKFTFANGGYVWGDFYTDEKCMGSYHFKDLANDGSFYASKE